VRPYRRRARAVGGLRRAACAVEFRGDLLPGGMEGDVVGRRVQGLWVVLELAQSTVAVETEQSPHSPSCVVVVDMDSRRRLADRTKPVLLGKQKICLGS
jgi:hypothetical protein